MRILLVMAYPGYLRYYDSTVRLLAERGHEVVLCFEDQGKQAEGLEALAGVSANLPIRTLPPPADPAWNATAQAVRRVTDYVRYLDPRLSGCGYLRRRIARRLPRQLKWIARLETLRPRPARLWLRAMLGLEGSLPCDPSLEDFLRGVAPDVIVTTPLVAPASRQPEVVRSAHVLGIPSMLGVASWDHLTSKGPIRGRPEAVVVWNEVQAREAELLHGVDRSRVVVTGAQPFDRWFGRAPATNPSEFRRRAGLPDGPYVLFVGSTASMGGAHEEQAFVREWISAIRSSSRAEVNGLGVLIRPHPYNASVWAGANLSSLHGVSVWPRGGGNPVAESSRRDFFDSLHHSSAVIGVNTSAMIEAAVVGRPVLTVLSPRFRDSQVETVHFRYLLPEHGGFVRAARSLTDHVADLEEAIVRPECLRGEGLRFVASFVRPWGLETEATPLVADAIESLARWRPVAPERQHPLTLPLRAGLWALKSLYPVLRGRTASRA